MSFEGKIAAVTGSSGGMGAAVARGLLADGAKVALIDIADPPQDLVDEDSSALVLKGDVSEEAFVDDAFNKISESFGRLDYLVNAAGVLWFGKDVSLAEIDLAVWDRVLDINLKSMVLSSRRAVDLMQRTGPGKDQTGGAMVHIASIQALRGDDRPQDAYQASKAAMISLSKSIAVQFAHLGIRSNSILPGGTMSPMQQRWVDSPEQLQAASASVPLGRVGTPEDMANAALFLLSDKASFITGTELIVDGGRTALP